MLFCNLLRNYLEKKILIYINGLNNKFYYLVRLLAKYMTNCLLYYNNNDHHLYLF